MKKNNQIKPASPQLFLTYIFDIPNVKTEYRNNAVKFALRQVYPGDLNNTKIDSTNIGNKTICTIISEGRYKQLNSSVRYYSPFFLLAKEKKDGIYAYITNASAQLFLIKDKMPVTISTHFTFEELTANIDNLSKENEKDNFKVKIFYGSNEKPENLSDYTDKGFEVHCLEDSYSLRKIQNSLLFQNTGVENKKKSIVPLCLMVVLSIGIVFFNVVKYKQDVVLQQNLVSSKKEYNELMAEYRNTNTKELQKEYLLNNPLPITQFLTDLSQIHSKVIINSIVISNKSFRVDLQGASALFVVNDLKKIDYLSNVVLHQSTKTADGAERFTISGDIHDEK